MSEILCQWLNQELKVSQTVSPKSFAKAFSSGYLIGEVLHKFELQDDFSEFSESRVSSAQLNNFSRLEPTLRLLGVQFDQNVAKSIITEKPGAATKLLYQLYTALQKKKKCGLTGMEIQTMQPLTNLRLQNMKSEAFRDQRLSRRRQNEIMAKIQAAIIQIPKPASNRTLKALEVQKMMKKKKEAEDVANEIKKFEALIKKDLQAKESAPKTSLDTAGWTTTDLLNTYSDDDYIKKIQKRLEEDAFAREQREKRRRRLLMDQLIAHEAQEEAYREEQLINRLMRQSQQERRIAVQLMHVRHEKEVLWQNRIFREKQYEERRLKDFQDALDREAALAKQAKIDSEEQALREKEIHERIAVERTQARYKKHYLICAEIFDQILDLSTKVADYRMLTNNLIPHKLMHDWKELFFYGKPIYEQAYIKPLQAKPSEQHLIELEKRDLLDNTDYEEYKNMVGEWALPEEMVDNVPPSNNCILGHVIHRLIKRSLPPQVELTEPELPSLAIKGCILGKTFSGKTTALKFLQKGRISFFYYLYLLDSVYIDYSCKWLCLVTEALPIQNEAEEKALPVLQENSKESPNLQNEFSAESVSEEALPETEDADTSKTPKTEEAKSSDSFSKLTVRAQLGAKSEKLLKKGKSISDMLLVSIMVNAINQIPVDQSWVLDGFPMTLNQAKLLEEALTGSDRNLPELEGKKEQISTLAVDPTAAREVPPPPAAFDFVMLLDISDNSLLNRMRDTVAEAFSTETHHKAINQRVAAKNPDMDENQNIRDQIQHRITGFLDNWPLLEQWFTKPKDILMQINAEVDKESLCQKVKEMFMTEMIKKENKVKKKLEEKEAEKKEEVSLADSIQSSPPPPPPEPEKEKETHPHHEHTKSPPAKGKPPSESPYGKPESLQEGKGKKGETSLKSKGYPKGKSGGKVPVKKLPAESTDSSPIPTAPSPPKPGSEEWVYVNEPIPEEMPSFLVPYWELIENSYVNSVKTVLRHLREDQHVVLAYLYEIKTSFQQFLRRPDHKQDFVSQWQADFNSLPEDLWDDEETKAELHQRVNDLRDRLWDICDARKEEAEQERLDIINESWLQDSTGITMNHFFSLMQAELNRFQDTKTFLQDYYRGMECKIPTADNKKFTRIPLVQMDSKEILESQLRIPLVSRTSVSLDLTISRPKPKTILKGKIDYSLEKIELNFEADEKLVMDTWQQTSSAISQMVAAEIHQRLLDEEKESQLAGTKEKSPQMGANKKVKKEPPKKKKEDKKGKGKSPPIAEVTPMMVTSEEIDKMEKENELRLKIKEEHLAALQFEETVTQFRLEVIKTKALAFLEDLVTKVVDVYKLMETWLGERYLNEMASVEKLTEVACYHIETSTKIQNELYVGQEDFFINNDIKVFPDPPPPIRPPPVEKEENGTLTINQLDSLLDQFLDIAPKGIIGNKTFTDILLDLVTLNHGTNNFPCSWMNLTQPELQELTSLLTVNSEFVDWRKFLLVTALPWPIPLEEELLKTWQRFKAVDEEQLGTVTFEQYMQVAVNTYWHSHQATFDLRSRISPQQPLKSNRQQHRHNFFFRLFADYEIDPPRLDYTQMLLCFACHPDPVEGVYRAFSVATGTHIFQPIEAPTLTAEETYSFINMSPIEEYPELEEHFVSEERELREEKVEKEEEIPKNANTEKIAMETLFKVFRGGNEAQDTNRFASHLKIENIYSEDFTKVFQDLGAKNLEPVEVAVLLKHPFIQDLISSYPDYKIPDIKIILQRSEHVQGSDGERSPSRLTEEKK
ncbi:PREDICTED: sperm flagellar protein 2 [Hipposideros armiger]|uniref:Sperm flagellar protein 2 n=1 Tax=Hipposideros armiger TaxID=186990 RepID=A0A8B7QIV7_HIPAR|nr:PREDICTED: sperm flagellar protein 2 [Hipposideros armiger]